MVRPPLMQILVILECLHHQMITVIRISCKGLGLRIICVLSNKPFFLPLVFLFVHSFRMEIIICVLLSEFMGLHI
jgi:hypothetical protein